MKNAVKFVNREAVAALLIDGRAWPTRDSAECDLFHAGPAEHNNDSVNHLKSRRQDHLRYWTTLGNQVE